MLVRPLADLIEVPAHMLGTIVWEDMLTRYATFLDVDITKEVEVGAANQLLPHGFHTVRHVKLQELFRHSKGVLALRFVVIIVVVKGLPDHVQAVQLMQNLDEGNIVFRAGDPDVALETGGFSNLRSDDNSRICVLSALKRAQMYRTTLHLRCTYCGSQVIARPHQHGCAGQQQVEKQSDSGMPGRKCVFEI